ncbi:MAG: peptidylprolyl isomerase [Spirochaetaceae bacterium]|jgi:FKBP-type peptidyl-prolyl cis-trans isomerase SlyD|nr:peptidylprolyl isomerase [Spirochaetaceae bacterium]
MIIKEKSVVSMHYKLTDESGQLLDASKEQPLSYIQGTNSLIPGLEKELEGKTIGDQVITTIPPEEAYGPVMPQLISNLPISTFKGVEKIDIGMEFEASNDNDEKMIVRVDAVNDDEVTINGNHPLAGKALSFDIKIVDVREASEEELSHGHAHGAGGHQH